MPSEIHSHANREENVTAGKQSESVHDRNGILLAHLRQATQIEHLST